MQFRGITLLALLWCVFVAPAWATPQILATICHDQHGMSVASLPLQGGKFVCSSILKVPETGRYVIDFKNTTTIAHFQHELIDHSGGRIILNGGISSEDQNPFLLRHGREVHLSAGTYHLITRLNSPYYLAQPELFVSEIHSYQQRINMSSAGALLMLGVLMGIFTYYIGIGMARGHHTERMYALFILGNLIFQGAALGAFSQLLGWHWFYLTSLPILFSNLAYVSFVCHLLGINQFNRPRLYQLSLIAQSLLVAMLVAALMFPNWMLEMDRYGVGIFLCFGLICGIRLSLQKHITAQLYLVAITVFGILGGLSISANRLTTQIWTIEQLGLLAVTVEAVLLALLVAYQINRMQKEKERMLAELQNTRSIAMTDRLTGMPNRHALENKLMHFPKHGCLIFLDMDNLKFFNDHYGHEVGDKLLKHFSSYLSEKLDNNAQLYRLGGDEFAIVCYEDDVEWCQHQVEYTNKQLQNEGFNGTGASMGIVFGHEAQETTELMRIADKRMYADKRSRKDRKEMMHALHS
ncbi:sensor domain-containing diguanylate cyclase [Methylophilus aquaticus]|uniref:diguanylate cyclase n=1 Tax=Methylophilus aquaticus TaxID=1971610 RepID=A0ABT9JW61_9PROT|nr:diguanylate cyclase [Methylophilus aquaticus]MDP8568376.1 diguanylate cyclase [Methylophilus aquaticus]